MPWVPGMGYLIIGVLFVGGILIVWILFDGSDGKRNYKYRIKRKIEGSTEVFYLYRKQYIFFHPIAKDINLKSAIDRMVRLKKSDEEHNKKINEIGKTGWVSEDEIKVEVL